MQTMMTPTRKYYFSRVEQATVYAKDEDEAREQLKQHYTETEDFVLDDVIEGIDIDGVFHANGET